MNSIFNFFKGQVVCLNGFDPTVTRWRNNIFNLSGDLVGEGMGSQIRINTNFCIELPLLYVGDINLPMVFVYLAKLLYHPKYGHPSITCHNQGSFDMPGYATISHFKYFELNLRSSMYKLWLFSKILWKYHNKSLVILKSFISWICLQFACNAITILGSVFQTSVMVLLCPALLYYSYLDIPSTKLCVVP